MKILVVTLILAIVCILMAAVPSFSGEAPPVSGQVTFLYYEDLERAGQFYGQTLGLKATTDLDWVKIYEVSPGSSVGLVSATGGAHSSVEGQAGNGESRRRRRRRLVRLLEEAGRRSPESTQGQYQGPMCAPLVSRTPRDTRSRSSNGSRSRLAR